MNGDLANGWIHPHNCTVYFEYGTTTKYGITTTEATGGGFFENIILQPGTLYHYRTVTYEGMNSSKRTGRRVSSKCYCISRIKKK